MVEQNKKIRKLSFKTLIIKYLTSQTKTLQAKKSHRFARDIFYNITISGKIM